MAADSPLIKTPNIPRTASKVSQSQICQPIDMLEGAKMVQKNEATIKAIVRGLIKQELGA
jgi:hypothetical protein